MNAITKVLIVDSAYCVAKSLLVAFIVFAPSSYRIVWGILSPVLSLGNLGGAALLLYLCGIPLILAVVTAVLAWKASGLRRKGLLAAMIAWIGLITVLETNCLLDVMFGYFRNMPT